MPIHETAAASVAAFAATDVDDIVILAVLFSRRDAGLTGGRILAGQLVGIGVLLAASTAAAAGFVALPDGAAGALGLIPVGLGLAGLLRARRAGPDDADEVARAATAPVASVWAVALITIANGGDNVAVYVPFLASLDLAEVGLVVAPVFAAMTVVWVLAAALVGTRPAFVALVDRAGRYAVPVVLIALGAWIVADSGLAGAVLP